MKTKNILLLLIILIFNSCIVKSLHPFYTKETLSFDKRFIGEWKDKSNAIWKVEAFKEEVNNEKDTINIYGKTSFATNFQSFVKDINEHAYFVERHKNNEKILFLAVPFKIKNQLFLDFIPFEYDGNFKKGLLNSHLVATHSLVKYDVFPDGKINIKWLDEDKIENLFEENKIKIKHEKIGWLKDKYLLTAKSKELQKFIKKYMASNDVGKWKTSIEFTLTKLNGKPE